MIRCQYWRSNDLPMFIQSHQVDWGQAQIGFDLIIAFPPFQSCMYLLSYLYFNINQPPNFENQPHHDHVHTTVRYSSLEANNAPTQK